MSLNLVPNAGQSLAQTQQPIFTNFTTINTGFSVDHQTFNSTNQGKHNQVTFQQLASAPTTLVNTDIQMYGLNNVTSGQTELYIKRGTAGTPYPITLSATATQPAISYTYLPSGILIQWGEGVTTAVNAYPAAGTETIILPNLGGLAYSTFYSVIITPKITGGAQNYVLSSNITGMDRFQVVARLATGAIGAASNFTWMTIGV